MNVKKNIKNRPYEVKGDSLKERVEFQFRCLYYNIHLATLEHMSREVECTALMSIMSVQCKHKCKTTIKTLPLLDGKSNF